MPEDHEDPSVRVTQAGLPEELTAASDPWRGGGLPSLNVAATCSATRALGPGLRAVVWVQGCPLNCRECIAPEWIPRTIARLEPPEALAERLLSNPQIEGFTFSGGEPMWQAAGLARLIRHARRIRDISLVCFTGQRYEQLTTHPPGPGVAELLAETDVLIDGPYIAERNDNRGLRGSSNQRVLHLSERLRAADYDFDDGPRRAEIVFHGTELLLVGVPQHGLAAAVERAVNAARRQVLATTDQSGHTLPGGNA